MRSKKSGTEVGAEGEEGGEVDEDEDEILVDVMDVEEEAKEDDEEDDEEEKREGKEGIGDDSACLVRLLDSNAEITSTRARAAACLWALSATFESSVRRNRQPSNNRRWRGKKMEEGKRRKKGENGR